MKGDAPSPRPLRVLIVHDSLSDNGGVRLTLDLAERFLRLGAAPQVLALQPARGVPEVPVPPAIALVRGVPRGSRFRRSAAGAAARLLAACRRADVVLSGSEVGLGLLSGYAAARLARRPFAVVVHAPLDRVLEAWVPPKHRAATRLVHRRADTAVCVSEAVAEGVRRNGLDARAVHVVPNAVDVERVRRLADADPQPEERPPTVVGLGRLSPEKGFDLLVRAHAELVRDGVPHRLELMGEGPERESLIRLAAELGVADSVSLPGLVRNQYPRLAHAAVLVLPSRHEGMPLAMLEALALEVPVIAARSAGGTDLLGPEQRFADESVPDLAATLRRHLDDPEPLRAAARAAAVAVQGRTLDDVAREYLEILEPLVRGVPERPRPQAADA